MGADARPARRYQPTELINGRRVAWEAQPGPQKLLVTCPVPDIMFGGARGGGKTDGLLGDFSLHAGRWDRHARGIIFRRSYDELEEVEARALEIYLRLGADWRAGRRKFIFPNGATLKLRYLERDKDAMRYQGHGYTWAAVDELGNFPTSDPIRKIKATLRSKHGVRCVFRGSANPGGPGHAWVKADYVDPAKPLTPFRDPRTGAVRLYIPSRLQDNLLLMQNDPAYVDRLKDSGPSWLVQAWLAGDWNATPEGGIIKGAWFRRYRTAPVQGGENRTVLSVDSGYKPNELSDPTVITVWIVTQSGFYLVDVFRKTITYPDLKRAVKSYAEQWRPDELLIEDKASGQSLIQDLREETRLPIIPVDPGQVDKATRLSRNSALFEAGRVFLPESAPWLMAYEIELTTFPLSPHADQVDSTSQFLDRMRRPREVFVG